MTFDINKTFYLNNIKLPSMSSIRPLASPALRGVLLCPSKRLLSTTAANRVAATPPRQPIYEGGDFVGDGGEQLPGKTPKSSNNLKNS